MNTRCEQPVRNRRCKRKKKGKYFCWQHDKIIRHIDTELTKLSTAYINAGYIGERIFPVMK